MSFNQKRFLSNEEIIKSYDLKNVRNIESTPKSKWKKLATRSPSSYSGAKSSGVFRETIAKLSRGLMLPIAMLPIAGLFLGVGSAIVNNAGTNEALALFGRVLQIPGNAIFSNLPILFCVAIAITFTSDAGTAGLSAVVGWIIFCALQSVFVHTNDDGSYTFLFYHLSSVEFIATFTTNIGIVSLQTSVFGGIVVGSIVAFLYNKFKNIQMPSSLGFFSGVRFIPIITFAAVIILSLIFCIAWPIIGIGIFKFGGYLSAAPFGINSLVFGYVERALVPFGLHHAFYMPLWQTSAGGQINLATDMIINGQHVINPVSGVYASWFDFGVSAGILSPDSAKTIVGDQNCWMLAYQFAGKVVTLSDGTQYVLNMKDFVNVTLPGGVVFSSANPGQYMQGKYPFMIFGLPAAALAMVMAAPKGQNRKLAFSTVIGAALTSFVTGITEPIEFTFLFLAPALFYGFHAVAAAISFWLMNLLKANMGMTFSGGFIDFAIYGILPDALGGKADCWKAVAIGAGYFPLYFFGFWLIIVKKNIQTPGRGTNTSLFTKKDYLAKKDKSKTAPAHINQNIDVSKLNNDAKLALEIIFAYGGKENIKNVDACITKLRIQVIDQSKVKTDELIKLGAKGVTKPSRESVYAVFGTKSDIIKNHMKDLLNKI